MLTMFHNPLTSIWLAGRLLSKSSAHRSRLVHRQWLRFLSSTTYKPVTRTAPRIPDIMLVYHAGTLKTSFLGVTKAATIIVFIYGTIDMAPSAWKDPDAGPWISAAGRQCSSVLNFIDLSSVCLFSNPSDFHGIIL